MLSKIRKNPKKSVFFSGLFCYGSYYFNNKYNNYQLRRKFCNEAKQLGDNFISPTQELTRITVIHNPISNNRNGSDLFKKNISPLLFLSGYKTAVIETTRAEEAKELMSVLKPEDQDCIYVAGGDGTLLEIATGLLRRSDLRDQIWRVPLAIAPLGNCNSFFNRWYKKNCKNINTIETCYESVSSIQKNNLKSSNALVIRTIPEINDNIESTNEEENNKAKEIYALSGLEWSLDRDVCKKGKGKWLFGPYRIHFQYIFTGLLGKNVSNNKSATLIYQENCYGCKKCSPNILLELKKSSPNSFFGRIIRIILPMYYKTSIDKEKELQTKYNEKCQLTNNNCGLMQEKRLDNVRGISVVMNNDQMKVHIRNKETNLMEYVKSGIKNLNNIPYNEINDDNETFECTQLKIIPDNVEMEKFYIDNEEMDVVPLQLNILKDALYFYS